MNSSASSNETWWARPSFWDIYSAAGGIGVFNTVFILLTNTLLIFTITTSKKLRLRFSNQLILSVAVCNWLYGAVWCPMKVDYIFTRQWRFGCWMHVAYQMYEEYIQIFITTWLIIVYNTCYIVERRRIQNPVVSKNKVLALRLGTLASPWVVAVVVILPLAMANLHPVWNQSVWTASYCAVILTRWADILLPCLCFFIPATVLMLQTLYVFVSLNSDSRSSVRTTPLNRAISRRIGVCVIAASLITVLLSMGEQVCNLVKEVYNWNNKLHVITWHVTDLLADFQKVALPLVWIFLPEIKEELGMKIKWRVGGRYFAEDAVEVTYYRNYAHD
ncbi:uncharacterized protein LOC121377451 [Gigantopelta aegis]|uniref:uncharacterized protein LOC121377451 n=1 Tax=Gigantopelta aegis TaxID=1735272 RepID=UPI001B88BB21|nr:uncharacterized protein LOC121377451 [Gigantopelta aegis]